jgi:hypothetical protein
VVSRLSGLVISLLLLPAAALAAAPGGAAADRLPYTVEAAPPFVLTRAVPEAGLLFEDPTDLGSRPGSLLVGHSRAGAGIPPARQRELAFALLDRIAAVQAPTVDRERALRQDGLTGIELVALAHGAADGAPVVVFQALLFDDDRYYHFIGLTRATLAEPNLARFRAMLGLFERRK